MTGTDQREKARELAEAIRQAMSGWVCNKCGYIGRTGPHHESENGCRYLSAEMRSDFDATDLLVPALQAAWDAGLAAGKAEGEREGKRAAIEAVRPHHYRLTVDDCPLCLTGRAQSESQVSGEQTARKE